MSYFFHTLIHQAISEVGEGEMAQLIITTPQLSLGSAEDRFLHDPHAPYPRNNNHNPDNDHNNVHAPYPADAHPYDPDVDESVRREGAELRGRNDAAKFSAKSNWLLSLIFCLCIQKLMFVRDDEQSS